MENLANAADLFDSCGMEKHAEVVTNMIEKVAVSGNIFESLDELPTEIANERLIEFNEDENDPDVRRKKLIRIDKQLRNHFKNENDKNIIRLWNYANNAIKTKNGDEFENYAAELKKSSFYRFSRLFNLILDWYWLAKWSK